MRTTPHDAVERLIQESSTFRFITWLNMFPEKVDPAYIRPLLSRIDSLLQQNGVFMLSFDRENDAADQTFGVGVIGEFFRIRKKFEIVIPDPKTYRHNAAGGLLHIAIKN